MNPWEPNESMPVRRAVDGQLYFAATDVTGMLRDIAGAITLHAHDGDLTWTSEGEAAVPLDAATMRTVARILSAQADQLDIQLIAIAGQ
ncbi:hypothetical protein [Streptomyces sp. cmx-4-9]|uniref:hypothetical protein n=1 Tax=Streptomyces sp. cmx-4-9 TaxID=2790941 RepID=UPI00397F66FD